MKPSFWNVEKLFTFAAVELRQRRDTVQCTIRYDTIEEFNVDSKAVYTA